MNMLIYILAVTIGLVFAFLLNGVNPKLSAVYAFQAGFFLALIIVTIVDML
jgi:hypothetical protein